MNHASCLLIGYLLGMFSPAAAIAKLKNINLRNMGTKNLGATNVTLALGRGYGAIVMFIDIGKSFLAGKLARWLFPQIAAAQLLAGLGAVLGHVYPVYMNFKGGKGLAAFGGMVGGFDLRLLLFYLTGGVALMLLVNRTVFLPMFACATFPIVVLVKTGRLDLFLIALATSALIAAKHWSNIGKVERGEEKPVRELFKKYLLHK